MSLGPLQTTQWLDGLGLNCDLSVHLKSNFKNSFSVATGLLIPACYERCRSRDTETGKCFLFESAQILILKFKLMSQLLVYRNLESFL